MESVLVCRFLVALLRQLLIIPKIALCLAAMVCVLQTRLFTLARRTAVVSHYLVALERCVTVSCQHAATLMEHCSSAGWIV
jgi:lysylphosphatidylglycerol synthetase-like protein (DUF2156 family)